MATIRADRRIASENNATRSATAMTDNASGGRAMVPATSVGTITASAASGARRRHPSATVTTTVTTMVTAESNADGGRPRSSGPIGHARICPTPIRTGNHQIRSAAISRRPTPAGGPR